jgi:hypothetical protein
MYLELLAKGLLTLLLAYVLLGLRAPINRLLAGRKRAARVVWVLRRATVIVLFALALFALWNSQVDVSESLRKFVKSRPLHSITWIATRDSAKIYQRHHPVGDIVGDVDVTPHRIVFARIANTGDLDPADPIEYRRLKLRSEHPGKLTGMSQIITNRGVEIAYQVRENVVCTPMD